MTALRWPALTLRVLISLAWLCIAMHGALVQADTVGTWDGAADTAVTLVPATQSTLSWTCGSPCWPGQTPPAGHTLVLKPLAAFSANDAVWAAVGDTAPRWHVFSELTLSGTADFAAVTALDPGTATVGSWDGNPGDAVTMVAPSLSTLSWTCGLPCWPEQTPLDSALVVKPLAAFQDGDWVWAAIGGQAPSWHSFSELASLLQAAEPIVTISGQPAATISAGSRYVANLNASDSLGRALSFSLANAPAWLMLDSASGQLHGTPGTADVGSYSGILVTASDAQFSATLPAFTLTVVQENDGVAQLSWLPPTTYTDGAVMTDLAGYRIYYGTDPTNLSSSVQLTNPGLSAYTLEDLAPGTYYFAITAYDSTQTESPRSAVVTKTVL